MERISHIPMRGRVRERCQTQWGEAVLFEPRREDIFRTEVGLCWWPVSAAQLKEEGGAQILVVPLALLGVVARLFEPLLDGGLPMAIHDKRIVQTIAKASEEIRRSDVNA